MRVKWIILEIMVAIAILLAWYFAVYSRTYPQVAMLRWIEEADAEAMFQTDLADGKRRFFSVTGFTVEILGIPDALYQRCYRTVPLELIDGTSDAALNDEHYRLTQQARSFAREYNLRMRTHIDRQTDEPCPPG